MTVDQVRDARLKLQTIGQEASRHVRPTSEQLEGYRTRLYNVVRSTGYDRAVLTVANAVEDEMRRRHNWLT